MGRHNMRTVFAVLALAAVVASVPTNFIEDVIPESELVQTMNAGSAEFGGEHSDERQWSSAKEDLDQLRTSKSDKECRDLADETEASVKKSVETMQKTIDKVDIGNNCHTLGVKDNKKAQDAKTSSGKALAKAEGAAKQAAKDAKAAKDA